MKQNKQVKVSEACIITSDEKGQRSLVGKAKEALTALSKGGVDVFISLESTDKEAAEKFLQENNVPYKELLSKSDDDGQKKFDACVLSGHNAVLLNGDWEWALNSLADKLYDSRIGTQKSEQQRMDDKWREYRSWADQAAKARSKRESQLSSASD